MRHPQSHATKKLPYVVVPTQLTNMKDIGLQPYAEIKTVLKKGQSIQASSRNYATHTIVAVSSGVHPARVC